MALKWILEPNFTIMRSYSKYRSKTCFFYPSFGFFAGLIGLVASAVFDAQIAGYADVPAAVTKENPASYIALENKNANVSALPSAELEAMSQIDLNVYYEFFIGGLRLGHIDLKASWDDSRYQIGTQIRTQGLADTLFAGRYSTSSNGRFDGHRISPRQYISDFVTSDDTQYVNLSFNNDEPTALVARPPYDLRYPVSRALKQNTVDPLSAYLHLVIGSSRDQGAPCGRALPIFDGKRRYDFQVKHIKDIKIRSGQKHGYRGPGYECSMQYEQIAGFKPRDKNSTPFPMIKVQVAKIEGGRFLIPVKFTIDTDFGAIVGSASLVQFEEGATISDRG